ncbi:hypothetical protein AXG93_1616s1050 [Marchantia polymorpha subsp. ruderalis]|uniref:Uncharacterized protein n=1 Tax=Marchantia polymorpha subsp. ruderalis TaxID=1480154 RepID=A0A176WS26_MARPO|nr:hypothetical protein AXG93_1616s1050 [Marchantia polymorpha subsp. ruderalis]
MVSEWLRERNQPPRGFRPHPEKWQVSDWEQLLGSCAGEEGHLPFECESVQVTKEEEISFGAIFKNSKSSKNVYKTCDYKDRLRRNVAVALLQIFNLGRYVKDVEVETDTDETPACTPPARPRAEEEPRAVRVPRKRKRDGRRSRVREVSAAPARSRAIHEPSSRPK